ncbi:MAG: mannose-1-phosphate guanylyltransferase/mannose-6-phosphate isomerase [Bdellovibrionales bacterium]|nr:mannose-1-phosphate guanylyltransferase/mannose-6-phosphate isomerase [Bdellovibrionales bacterium]
MIPVILSGGQGTRLWPISRSNFPKQFIPFRGETLFARTLNRVAKYGRPWVITNHALVDLTRNDDSLSQIDRIVGEPTPKNTAPAIATACHLLRGRINEVIGVFPADHLVEDETRFHKSMQAAVHAAQSGHVATLGVVPTYAATGYGYIQTDGTGEVRKATRFCEKPDEKTAEEFLKSGNYFWNAGIFVFRIGAMIELFEKHMSEMWTEISHLKEDLSNLSDVFSKIKSDSIDYGVMEKLSDIRCVPLDAGWSDVGSWDEILKLKLTEDRNLSIQSHNCNGVSEAHKTFAFIGVDNISVIESEEATLIFNSGESQRVKEVYEKIKNDEKMVKNQRVEFRPWGSFEILRDEPYFKSKVIRVLPGKKISYQSHEKRSENWVIVKGSAKVTLNDKEITLQVGESIFVPAKSKHRIENTGSGVLEFIEVQTGTYFGEDDITRYQDDFGRA